MVTVSGPDAREGTTLSCRNEELWWQTWQFREVGRATQIPPKPVSIAVSRTHCHSLAKKARLPSRMDGDANMSKMEQVSCMFVLHC